MLVIVIFYAVLLNKNSVNTYGNNMLADSCCEQLCTVHCARHLIHCAAYCYRCNLQVLCFPSLLVRIVAKSKNLCFKIFDFLSDKVEYFLLVFYSVNY